MAYLIKQKQLNSFIPDNSDTGLVDSITFFRKGKVKDVQVKVNISHPFNGDLEVFLKSPSGTSVRLHERTGQQEKNLNATFVGGALTDLAGEETSGNWEICVKDHAVGDQGYLQNWSVRVNCDETDKSEMLIPEKKGKKVVSQQLCETKGKVQEVTASVEIEGAPIGDLTVTLKGPKKSVVLHDKKGGKKKELSKTYSGKSVANLVGSKAEGVWSLEVKTDKGSGVGRIKSWNVDLKLA